jgi:arylsulfatase A-like enzyme
MSHREHRAPTQSAPSKTRGFLRVLWVWALCPPWQKWNWKECENCRVAFLACSLLAALAPARAADERPNLIVILADDLGYSDLGCYGGELATPALDRLAREGVRLARFFNGGMCVATRASLLSGQWSPRIESAVLPAPVLPAQLRAAGYRTALIGKWHLPGHPLDRGFEHFFGFLGGFADHFAGGKDYQLDRAPFREFGPDYHSTDAFAARAIRFIAKALAAPAAAPPPGAGESFLPLLRGADWQRRAPLFFQRADNRALRDAEWTLAAVDGGPWELYRAADVLESADLAAAQPAIVARLAARWDEWWRGKTGRAYVPESTRASRHYSPQGDRGSGRAYAPSAMPGALAGRYPVPSRLAPLLRFHPATP